MKPTDQHLQSLLEAYVYEALPPADREMVDAQLGEEAYRQHRLLLLTSQGLFAEEGPMLQPDPAIHAQLKARLKPQRKSSFWAGVMAVFFRPVPAYQMGFGVLLLAFGIWVLWPKPEVQLVYQSVPQIEVKTDTVVVEREVIKEIPVVVTRVEYVEQAPPPIQPIALNSSEEARAAEGNQYLLSEAVREEQLKRSLGNTAFEEGELDVLLNPLY